ncbi:MAG: helix-turn-helix domain-containing protein [Planctomycetota bacterium]
MASRYGQYCPVALATEILGERWTILVLLALLDGVGRFNDLQRALPRISATMLSQRLRSLERAGLLRKKGASTGHGHEYSLTEAGQELEGVVMGLGRWGQRWARDMNLDDMDPRHLAWSMHLRMNIEAMPAGRTVLRFEFTGVPDDCRRFWIVNRNGTIDMCIEDPGFDVDLTIKSDLRRFVEAWRGIRSLRAELAAGRISLDGPRELQRSFPDWLLLSALAHVGRERPGQERTTHKRYNRE